MVAQITLDHLPPILSVRLLGEEAKFVCFSFHPPKSGEELLLWLSRVEAFTLWNFLDEVLEIPLEGRGNEEKRNPNWP
jgi:hypothetical protein